MKKSTKIIIFAVCVVLLFGVGLFAIITFSLNKPKNADFYEMGNDKIASVKTAVGVRDVHGVSSSIENGVQKKTYQYVSDTVQEDVDTYINYLRANEEFLLTELTNTKDLVYAKPSVDEGKLLILQVIPEEKGYTVTLQKVEGTMTYY